MEEVRQGLSDTTLSDSARANLAQHAGLQANLRQAHEHASVMGRCGGSLSGKCCKLFAPLAKPVIEQLNRFHNATIRVLEQMAGTQSEMQTKMQELEDRLRELESKESPERET